MIEKLHIHRFRGIREGVLEDFGKVNLFIGPNNSGKTAILEMLYLIGVCGRECQVDSDKLYNILSKIEEKVNAERAAEDELEERITVSMPQAYIPHTEDFLGYRPFSRIWQRHGELALWENVSGGLTPEKSLVYRLEQLPKEHPLRTFHLIAPPSESLQSFEGFSEQDVYTTAMFKLDPPEKAIFFPPELLPEFIKDVALEQNYLAYLWYPSFVHYKSIKSTEWDENMAVWAVQGAVPDSQRVLLFDFHTAHDHFYKSFFDKIYQLPDSFERVADAMGKIFSELEGCRVNIVPFDSSAETPMMRGDIRLAGRPPLPVDAFGDGARHAFKVLASLITMLEIMSPDETGLFLWEDPELFMHPKALGNLLNVVMELVKDKPIQVFVTSQSLDVAAHFVDLVAKEVISEDDLRAFRLENERGILYSARFEYENLYSWLESGLDPRFIDNANTLLTYRLEGEDEF